MCMEKTTNPFIDDNFARHVGIELIDAAKGSARAKLDICGQHLNGAGCAHGGAIFTLAVWTMAVAANQDTDTLSVGLNADISWLRAARGGTLTAQAKLIADAKRVATYHVIITNENNQTVAVFKGLAYKKFT